METPADPERRRGVHAPDDGPGGRGFDNRVPAHTGLAGFYPNPYGAPGTPTDGRSPLAALALRCAELSGDASATADESMSARTSPSPARRRRKAVEWDGKPLRRARACPNCQSMRRSLCKAGRFNDRKAIDWQFVIECQVCGLMEGSAPTPAEAISRWNEIPRMLGWARACPDCHGMRRWMCERATFTDGKVSGFQFAIECQACGLIEGDAPTRPEAVARWNEIPRRSNVATIS